jgi:hypothetical protein
LIPQLDRLKELLDGYGTPAKRVYWLWCLLTCMSNGLLEEESLSRQRVMQLARALSRLLLPYAQWDSDPLWRLQLASQLADWIAEFSAKEAPEAVLALGARDSR